jgi:anhydro-N-acetylmuramic acid kinase
MSTYYAIGLMSGTSLDGLDLAWCSFDLINNAWNFRIHRCETLPYTSQWEERLRSATSLGGNDLVKLHYDYGYYCGEMVNEFISRHKISTPGIIASHGHTVFHRPALGYTFQIGSGAAIAAKTRITTVCDFRSLDVGLGGQGAPLVPIGDKLLFPQYTHCLNLGGFANISFEKNSKRVAFDICPVNFVINKIVRKITQETRFRNLTQAGGELQYDPNGSIGRMGKPDQQLLRSLNSIPFYSEPGPKSLGEEWVNENFLPLIKRSTLSPEDLLRTIYEHISHQIASSSRGSSQGRMLVTGGGAHNNFLIELISDKLYNHTEVVVPEKELVDFKEALLFSFLGILRISGQPNCLSAVTGSLCDNIGGGVYTP